MPKTLERQLTEFELELMQVIWKLGECTIREVFDSLPKARGLAYTTVATMIKILEQKGAIACDRSDRAISVKPKMRREDYELASLKKLSQTVFQGQAGSMVSRLLEAGDLNEEELLELKRIVEERLKS